MRRSQSACAGVNAAPGTHEFGNLFLGRLALKGQVQDSHGHVGRGHTDGVSGQFALQLRQHLAHRLGSASLGQHHIQRRAAPTSRAPCGNCRSGSGRWYRRAPFPRGRRQCRTRRPCAFSGGAMALVVHDAAEIMVSPGSMMSLLIPATTFFMSPLPGAVRMTLAGAL